MLMKSKTIYGKVLHTPPASEDKRKLNVITTYHNLSKILLLSMPLSVLPTDLIGCQFLLSSINVALYYD